MNRRVSGWLVCVLLAACGGDSDLAGGVRIGDAVIFQGPAVPLIANGELVTTRNAPVLAGRQGRLHVVLASYGDELRTVRLQLELSTPTGVHRATVIQNATITGARTDVDLELAADTLDPDDELALSVLEAPGFSSSYDVVGGRFPESGTLPLDARPAPRFHVVILPTGPSPPTFAQDRVDAWHAALEALLPVSGVDLEVADPVPLARDLTKDAEWNLLLGDIAAWRASQHFDPATFVFGGVAPVDMTTVGGISASITGDDPYWRVAAGQMAGGDYETNLINHELGHAIGRSHAPCGNPGGPDHAYPYLDGKIGVTGLDFRDPDQLRDPGAFFDVLSYCNPVFVSDYGFGAAYRSLTVLGERSLSGVSTPEFIVDPVTLVRGQP